MLDIIVRNKVLNEEEIVYLLDKTNYLANLCHLDTVLTIKVTKCMTRNSGKININFYKDVNIIRHIDMTLSALGYLNRGFSHLMETFYHEFSHIITFKMYGHVDHNHQFQEVFKLINCPLSSVDSVQKDKPLKH